MTRATPTLGRDIFTTGMISTMLGVAPRTVSKWIDLGKLQGYRLPHSLDRRVSRDKLVAFITEYFSGMELPAPLRQDSTLVVVGGTEVPGFTAEMFRPAQTWFEAGMLCDYNMPAVIVVYTSVGDALPFVRRWAKDSRFARVTFVALAGDDACLSEYIDAGYHMTFKPPYLAADVAGGINKALGGFHVL